MGANDQKRRMHRRSQQLSIEGAMWLPARILEWLNLSNKYNFELIIRNYSNHKHDIATRFFSDLTGVDDFCIELPRIESINRSLTHAEINFQSVMNTIESNINRSLSDDLVNNLPVIKSTKLGCSREVYNFVVERNFESFELINKHLGHEESLKIEPPEDVIFEGDLNVCILNEAQISVISDFLSPYLKSVSTDEIDSIRDIALRISKSTASLEDALCLMEIALRQRPGCQAIKKYVSYLRSQ